MQLWRCSLISQYYLKTKHQTLKTRKNYYFTMINNVWNLITTNIYKTNAPYHVFQMIIRSEFINDSIMRIRWTKFEERKLIIYHSLHRCFIMYTIGHGILSLFFVELRNGWRLIAQAWQRIMCVKDMQHPQLGKPCCGLQIFDTRVD